MQLIRQVFADFLKVSPFIFREKKKLFLYFTFLCTYIGAKQVFPLFLREIVDVYIPQRNLEVFSILLYSLFFIKTFEFLSMIGSSLLGYLVSSKFSLFLKINFLRSFFKLKAAFVDNQTTGAVMQRLNGDVNNIQMVVYDKAFELFSDLLQIAWLIPIILWLSPPLALLIFFVMPINVYLSLYFGKKNRQPTKVISHSNDVMSSFLFERVKNYKMVKYFSSEKIELMTFVSQFKQYARAYFRKTYLSQISIIFYQLSVELTPILILFFGGHLIFKGACTLGTVLALINYSNRIFYPLRNLLSATEDFNQLSLSLERYNEYFIPENFERKDGDKAKVKGNLVFEGVSFSYQGREQIFSDLNFDICQGAKIAFVGGSGVGKTSILNMSLGIYKHNDGKILVDGSNIDTLDLAFMRKQIGVVSQDTFILNGTLHENIVYGQRHVNQKDVDKVCYIAALDEVINNLPAKYDTIVGENGVKLSGGEKQRLAIARVLLRKKDLYFFDEATSQIDVVLEKKIWKRLFEFLEHKTVIIIAHRLSTITDVDKIFVVKNKKIAESGSHSDLLSLNGIYANMWSNMLG